MAGFHQDEFDNTHDAFLDDNYRENTFEGKRSGNKRLNDNDCLLPSIQRQDSLSNFQDKLGGGCENHLDDCFLERQPAPQRQNSTLFFGLALVFGAIGAVTSVTSPPSETYFDGSTVEFSSGPRLKEAGQAPKVQMIPDQLKDQVDDDQAFMPYKVDPSSTS